jgi:hypothetical protein
VKVARLASLAIAGATLARARAAVS